MTKETTMGYSDQEPITPAEMTEMFGEVMPMVAVELLWNADEYATVGQVRAALRNVAKMIEENKNET